MSKNKKAATEAVDAKLAKKERRKLEERESEIRAELERRAAKKAKKKSKKAKAGAVDAAPAVAAEEAPAPKSAHSLHLDHVASLHATIDDPASKPKARAKAQAELDALRAEGEKRIAARDAERPTPADETVDEIKARVDKKRAARETEDERKAKLAALQKDVEENGQISRVRAAMEADKAGAGDAAEAEALDNAAAAVAAIGQVVDAVETEAGRIFEAGTSEAVGRDDFATPSEAPKVDFDTNGLNQYKIQRPGDGKLVGYTRVTTYIACLEDMSSLTDWKMRLLLEGVAIADGGEGVEPVTPRVRAIAHNRDVAISKARKADKKGKLEPGALGALVAAAEIEFKREMRKVSDEAFELAGGRDKARKGTDIHALCDLHDREGLAAVGDLLTEGKITPADFADVEAYAEAIKKLGAKIIEAERVIVNDELKVAGRLDRIVMVKLPGEARARRRVLDIKTGRVDYGAGKIAQQISMYASAKGYDLNTHEREDLKVDPTKGLLLHLPAGEGKATVHVVDLTLGRKGNKLAGEVRAWRNEGKKAIDISVDVLAQIESESTND